MRVIFHNTANQFINFERNKNQKNKTLRALRMNLDELLYENVDLSTDDGVDAVREKIRSLNVSLEQINNLFVGFDS